MSAPPEPEYLFVAIMLAENGSKVLVQKDSFHISFPRIQLPFPFPGSVCDLIAPKLLAVTNVSFEFGYLFFKKRNRESAENASFFAVILELHRVTDGVLAGNFEWMDLVILKSPLISEEQDVWVVPYIQQCIADEGHENFEPWQRPGWFHKTVQRMSQSLAPLGFFLVDDNSEDPVVKRVESEVALLKAKTNKGFVYLKAGSLTEFRVSEIAARICPELTRKPLVVSEEYKWMVMEDCGPTLSDMACDVSEAGFRNLQVKYAKLQLKSVQHLPELLQAGVSQVDVNSLIARANVVLNNNKVIDALCEATGEHDVSKWSKIMADFYCHLYRAHKLPLTLLHGDFAFRNTTQPDKKKDEYLLIDWQLARIDLPFYDIIRLENRLRFLGTWWKEDIIDNYLQVWSEYGSVKELKALLPFFFMKYQFDGLARRNARLESQFDPRLEKEVVKYASLVLPKIRSLIHNVGAPIIK